MRTSILGWNPSSNITFPERNIGRWIVVWLLGEFGYVFEHFGPVRGLDAQVAGVAAPEVAALAADASRWRGRGQMGEYWAALRTRER